MRIRMLAACLLVSAFAVPSSVLATETENQSFRVLPVPGKVVLDGNIDDWDLSGGIFACGEVEHLRDQYAVWFHAMYDADNLYILARWKDTTPLNNPETLGGHGFNGDCLQVRFILFPDSNDKTTTWWTMWRDAKGLSVIDRGWPGARNGIHENPMEDLSQAIEQGARQAFKIDADGKGYSQEIAIPWKMLSVSGAAPKPGSRFRLTIEPNFTAGQYGRITIKDIFDDKIASPDRVFTFRAYGHWGWAKLEEKGHVELQPVRLADGRTFKTSMRDGMPAVDWTGLIHKFEWPGFAPVTFDMPFDGYTSLNIVDSEGKVVRHLLNWDSRSAGKQTVQWDGLTDATYRTPGEPVPAGSYSYSAIAHPGAKITFRGFAGYGGRAPWMSSPLDDWLGDHGVPTAVIADGNRMYLACNGAEGGRHLLSTDLDGHVIWGLQNSTGGGDPEYIAVDGGAVFVLHNVDYSSGRNAVALTRADALAGSYAIWKDHKDHILKAGDIWEPNDAAVPFSGISAKDGKIYLAASDPVFGREDVLDWKIVITQLKKDDPIAKSIMSQIEPSLTRNLDNFLAGKITAEKAFEYGPYNFQPYFFRACQNVIDGNALADGGKDLTDVARQHANRKVLDAFFAGGVRPEQTGRLLVLDEASGKLLKTWPLPMGTALCAVNPNLVYAISGGKDIVAIDPQSGQTRTVIPNLSNARGLTVTKDGGLLVTVRAPDMQVRVFAPEGKDAFKQTGTVGRKGGRPPIGPWQADALYKPSGVAVDAEGKLWVMESYEHPKRVSVWNLKDGSLIKDFFGPAQYGASGSAINPANPNLMISVGCEWRLDPNTGRSACLGAFDTVYHNFATFRKGSNGRLYLYTWDGKYGYGDLKVWERLGDANFALRADLRTTRTGADSNGRTELWVDRNGDGHQQADEIQTQESALLCCGSNNWSLNLGPDLVLYAFDLKDKTLKSLPADGFTDGGAPKYDLAKLKAMPEAMSAGYQNNNGCALPSADNKRILLNLFVKDNPAGYLWECFELSSGKLMWTYPNPYFQVGGSHSAPPPEPGLFRGAYGPVGAVNIPGAGQTWIINGNLGEWEALTADGYFLTRLFNGNIFEWHWPTDASPGADMTNLPSGCGGEDFGGSVTQADDGKVYIEAGKSCAWNCLLTGLDKTVPIPGGNLTITPEQTQQARALREQALQASAGSRKAIVKRATVAMSGNLYVDFKDIQPLQYRKTEDSAVRTWLAHDDTTLYVAWEVHDSTPWVNGAKDISQIYSTGDTVDLQLAADPNANPKRSKAVAGDLRIAIGNFDGKNTAVLYKFVSDVKKPRTFSSGVVQSYQVDYVAEMPEAVVKVKTDKERYTIEAAIPLSALGVKLSPNLMLRGDVGVTHGDPSGARTKLRTYWANQQTGLVDDVVFELQLSPQNWGELTFE